MSKHDITRLSLTAAERFVLAEVRDSLAGTDDVVANEQAAVIDGLLERTKAFFDRHASDKNAGGWSPGEKV